MSENKEFYVTIQGKKVVVTEEVYRAYVRPIRTEQRRERRAWKCQVMGEKGNLVRCKGKCSKCEYANDGNKAMGNILSLDKLLEKGVEIADKGVGTVIARILIAMAVDNKNVRREQYQA